MPTSVTHMQQQQQPPAVAGSSNIVGGASAAPPSKEPVARKMSAGHRMSTTPRKFAEKIAYLQRMNEAGQAQFDEVIRDVHALTGAAGDSVARNNCVNATGSASMSLPNVHHVVSIGTRVCARMHTHPHTLQIQVHVITSNRTMCTMWTQHRMWMP